MNDNEAQAILERLLAGAKRAVAHLKRLQDLLGELHDLQVLTRGPR